jgi:hypothetical protein
MLDTQLSLEIFRILSQFHVEPRIVANFSQLTSSMPKLLAGMQINIRLFFENDRTNLPMAFEQIMQLHTVFKPFLQEKKLIVDVFAAGYYDLYDTLVAAKVGKLSDEELLKALLETSDVKTFLRYNGTTLYEQYQRTHSAEDIESLHIRNKL